MNKVFYKGNFKYCFFSRKGGVSENQFQSLNCSYANEEKENNVKTNRNIILKKFKSKKKIILMNQVHSKKIVKISTKNPKIIDADGMISKRSDIILGILTADCAPIIILGKSYFGIIHAGWRGALSGIVEEALNFFKMAGEFPENISVIVGPHIKKESFEVRNDFLNNLKEIGINQKLYIEKRNNLFFFDLSKFLFHKIKSLNIKNITISSIDTFKNSENYFSYRYYLKKGIKNCGRQISLVGIKD